jgi:hypothetical protein
VYLILALIWLLFAAAMFVLSYIQPDAPYLHIGGSGVPVALIGVCFFVYNLLRWRAERTAAQRRRMLREPLGRRRYHHEREPRREQPPDPNFNFTDQPPPR